MRTIIIVAPQANIGLIKTTVNSIKNNLPGWSFLISVTNDIKKDTIEELSEICNVVQGKTTITSLINAGVKASENDWNFIVFEGTSLQKSIENKFFKFVRDKKDIGFPIIVEYDYMGKPKNLNSNFVDGSMNGILIHKETFKKIGNMTDNPLPYSKLMWSLDAIAYGCTFKGILGAKVC